MKKTNNPCWAAIATAVVMVVAFSSVAQAAAADELNTWWKNRRLMLLRDAYIEQEIEFIEDFSEITHNPFTSEAEWRCTVAENTFALSMSHPLPNDYTSERLANLKRMRMAWQREVIGFYCLGTPIGDDFDAAAHEQMWRQYKVQRYDWRPNHALPGPRRPSPLGVGITGITDTWWNHPPLQALRTKAITTFLAQNTAIARVLEGTGEDVNAAARELAEWQGRGLGSFSRLSMVMTNPLDHRHFISAMELMRGFEKEVCLHLRLGVPVAGWWTPQEFERLISTRNLGYSCIYRKLSPVMKKTNCVQTFDNFEFEDQ